MAATGSFFVGCDTAIVLNQLKDDQGTVVANATIVGTLYLGSVVVPGGDLTFSPVSGVPGDYNSVIPAALNLAGGKTYNLFVTVTMPGGKIVEFRITRLAKIIDI